MEKSPSSSLWEQWKEAARWAKWVAVAFAVLFVLNLLGAAAQVYSGAATIHPLLGGVVAVGFLVLAGILLGVPIYRFARVPSVLTPPPIPPADRVTPTDLMREIQFIDRYLTSLERNTEVGSARERIPQVRHDLDALTVRARSVTPHAAVEVSEELSGWVARSVLPLMTEIDAKADRIIYQEALSVGLSTAVSPNGTLDAFLMLWRSTQLVSRLATLYYGRPGIIGTLTVCRDVSMATAMAGTIHNVTDSLGGLVAKSVGGVAGVVAGPAMEGVTNGIVLIRIGYLARERCRAFRQWDTTTRTSAVLTALHATQRVALGLTKELLLQLGGGLGYAMQQAAGGAAKVAGGAGSAAAGVYSHMRDTAGEVVHSTGEVLEKAKSSVGQAVHTVVGWGQAVVKGKPAKEGPGT